MSETNAVSGQSGTVIPATIPMTGTVVQGGTAGGASVSPLGGPESETRPVVQASAPKTSKLSLPHLAGRLFNVPLAVAPARLQTLLAILGPRFMGQDLGESDMPAPSHVSIESDQSIAVIPIVGTLVKRGTPGASFSDISYDEISASFLKALHDDTISAVVFDLDSPGGEVNGMLDLADTIFKARGTKPIIAVANEFAASAAYALASAADKVVIPRTGTVGSVGVLAVHLDVSAFDKKKGLKFTTISAGERKTDGNPHEPLSEEAQAIIQAEVDRIYGLFTETIARNRAMSVEAVRKTEAAVYSGEQAVAVGFADEVGTLASAIAGTLKERADRMRAQDHQDDIRAAVKENTVRNLDIAKLCQLAGLPQYIAEFQERELSADEVKAELLRRRAQRDREDDIQSHILPAAGGHKKPVIDYEAIYGRLRGAH